MPVPDEIGNADRHKNQKGEAKRWRIRHPGYILVHVQFARMDRKYDECNARRDADQDWLYSYCKHFRAKHSGNIPGSQPDGLISGKFPFALVNVSERICENICDSNAGKKPALGAHKFFVPIVHLSVCFFLLGPVFDRV